MLKILTTKQIRETDAYTIENEPVKPIDLMERAAKACYDWLRNKIPEISRKFVIFCGPGNNGGDGFAIARMLMQNGYETLVFLNSQNIENLSPDCRVNYERYLAAGGAIKYQLSAPDLSSGDVIIDALFGSGLSKPIQGEFASMIEVINKSEAIVVSIDIPSGLFADKFTDPKICPMVHADYTLSFQFPKLAFFFPENELIVGEWHILDIGLHRDFIKTAPTSNYFITTESIKTIYKPRNNFAHKGTYGHSLLFSGSEGKMGAAILASHACLRSGAGLVTVHIPRCGYEIMQIALPEAMISLDSEDAIWTSVPHLESHTSIGAGPGIGADTRTAQALKLLIQEAKTPLVLDADALNILSENKTWLAFLPKGTILTPHPKEFERLSGKSADSFERVQQLREFCIRFGCYVILKGHYTITCSPTGVCYFNSTGNPGMATAGSGDCLTGIILGLLAQQYTPLNACLAGVFLHGLAGDLAAEKLGYEALLASDIIMNLGNAFKTIY